MNIEKIESLFDENNLSEVGKVFFANMELRADLDQGKYCSLLLQDLNNSSDLSKAKRILALTLNYPHLVEHIFLKCNYVRTVIDQIGETFFKSEDMWVNACHLGHLSHIVKNWNSYGRQIVIGGYTDDCAKMLRVYKYARLSGNDLVAKELLGRFLTNHLNRIRFAAKIAGESALVCVISTCFAELIGIMVHYGLNHNQFPHRACALCALKINHLQLSRQVLFKCVVLYVLLLALFYMGITTTIALCGIGFLFFKDLYKGYYLSSTPGMDDNKKQIWTVPR